MTGPGEARQRFYAKRVKNYNIGRKIRITEDVREPKATLVTVTSAERGR